MSETDRGGIGAGSFERVLQRLRHEDARHLVVQTQGEPVAGERKDSDEDRDRPLAAQLLGEAKVAKILQTTLDEEGSADKKLTQIAEKINVEAMADKAEKPTKTKPVVKKKRATAKV